MLDVQEALPPMFSAIAALLNETYRGGEGWTTEKGLVTGQRADEPMLQAEVSKGYRYFVWLQQGAVQGCFNLSQTGHCVEIGALAIQVDLQGAGWGGQLLQAAERVASGLQGVARLRVSVLAPRAELLRFYEARGYCSTLERYPFPVARGVGVPLVDNLQVVVLEKDVRA